MNYEYTEEQIIDEVVSNVGKAQKHVAALKAFAGAFITGSNVPDRLMDVIATYDKSISFYLQNRDGRTVTLHGEDDSRINDAIKEGLNG